MKCWLCNRAFKQDDLLIPLEKYIVNEKRGDFTSQATVYIHASHLKKLELN